MGGDPVGVERDQARLSPKLGDIDRPLAFRADDDGQLAGATVELEFRGSVGLRAGPRRLGACGGWSGPGGRGHRQVSSGMSSSQERRHGLQEGASFRAEV